MRTLIIFREGLSGHYLKSLVDDLPVEVHFRMDPWYPGIYNVAKGKKKLNESCVCRHFSPNIGFAEFEKEFDLVLNIQPNEKIYQAVYNVFFKKVLVETFTKEQYNNWKNDLIFWYDKSYYSIQEYFYLFDQDRNESRYSNVIDFDCLLLESYVEEIFAHYYNRPLTNNMKLIIEQYREKQLNINLTRDGLTMQEIVDPIADSDFDQHPWYASYCIFKYEFNNGLLESQRSWSIDSVKTVIDKKFLLEIQHQYC